MSYPDSGSESFLIKASLTISSNEPQSELTKTVFINHPPGGATRSPELQTRNSKPEPETRTPSIFAPSNPPLKSLCKNFIENQ